MGEVKEFRVSSLSSAAEQRRLFAMHFVLRSSGKQLEVEEEDGYRQEEEVEVESGEASQGERTMEMVMDGEMKVLRT